MLKSKDIHQRLKDIKEFLLEQYKESKEEKKRDWRTYEQQLTHRIKGAVKNLRPLVKEAVQTIKVHRGRGRKPSLNLEQKVILLLLRQLFGKSNRTMACMLAVFSLLSDIDVSYKTIERLYSDTEVDMAINNLHQLILKKKGVNNVDGCGDGTGYSLTIKKHYASVVAKRKDKAKKENKGKNLKKSFVYSFKILDLKTKMYVAYGASLKSEKQAFKKAIEMLKEIDIEMESVRLDRYYSLPSYVDEFEDAKVYVIPRKNATFRGSRKWKRTMAEFVNNTLPYLGQYYLRNNSEAGFSADKRWFGWKIEQKREDRIETALACQALWHNLFNLYTS